MTKNNKSKKGFTIVELLVVIVVIGILAAISVVSYSGISARAKTTTAQEAARGVAAVANAYYADKGSYPTTKSQITSYTIVRIPSTTTIAAAAAANSGNTVTVRFQRCDTGFKVTYFDHSTNSATTEPIVHDNGTACITYTDAS